MTDLVTDPTTVTDRTAGTAIHALGWDPSWAAAFEPFAAEGRRPARVIAVHKETAIVREGAVLADRSAVVSGRFRFDVVVASDYPAVGDWVALEPDEAPANGADSHAVIAAVLPRRSAFRRRASDSSRRREGSIADDQIIAANVDVAFLVAGLDGDFNLRRLERYLAVAWASGVLPVVVLNKADVADDLDGRLVAVEAIAPGVPIVVLSALTGDHVTDLTPHLGEGRTAVVLGSSGVGKSTLVNALLGEQRQSTGAVREGDSRGRHTTTHRELFALASGALLIDTPGIRSLEVAGADAGVEEAFDDINELAATCRFSDCRHEGEPGCAVRSAVADGRISEARLASHRKLEREAAHAERRGDPRLQAEERKRWKSIHKAVSRHMDSKYGEGR
jgi:ribosome biogenesis GTPase